MDDSASLISPSSDDRFWNRLRNRVETILEDRRLDAPATCGVESQRGKRLREDSLLLIRGLDSVGSSLAQLSDTLTAAQKGVNALATCNQSQAREHERGDDEEPKAKRQCSSTDIADQHETPGAGKNVIVTSDSSVENEELVATDLCQHEGDKPTSVEVAKSTNLNKARNLAVSMAGRAAVLARELKNIKSELHFMQERCTLLEEENRRLREGYDKGVTPEEDDLVRLQLEALLAEKSRLAQENANLRRENQSLIQLVEYHQLTSQDLSASYEDVIQGMCLDFSSPLGKIDSDEEGSTECEHDGAPVTPADKLGI